MADFPSASLSFAPLSSPLEPSSDRLASSAGDAESLARQLRHLREGCEALTRTLAADGDVRLQGVPFGDLGNMTLHILMTHESAQDSARLVGGIEELLLRQAAVWRMVDALNVFRQQGLSGDTLTRSVQAVERDVEAWVREALADVAASRGSTRPVVDCDGATGEVVAVAVSG